MKLFLFLTTSLLLPVAVLHAEEAADAAARAECHSKNDNRLNQSVTNCKEHAKRGKVGLCVAKVRKQYAQDRTVCDRMTAEKMGEAKAPETGTQVK